MTTAPQYYKIPIKATLGMTEEGYDFIAVKYSGTNNFV
jgi:hypothetical protein